MSAVSFRPAVAADLAFIAARLGVPDSEVLQHRAQLVTAELAGEIVGIGGVLFAGATVYATILIDDALRAHKFALHRAVVHGLRRCRGRGIRRIIAFAEPGRARAEEWLHRLGFVAADVDGRSAWIWEA